MFVSNPANEIYLLWKCPAGLELVLAVFIGQVLKFFSSFFFFLHCFVAAAMHGISKRLFQMNIAVGALCSV